MFFVFLNFIHFFYDMIQLIFQNGTILLKGISELPEYLSSYCVYDERVEAWRAQANQYAPIVTCLYRRKVPYQDHARDYKELDLYLNTDKKPRNYQQAGLQAWKKSNYCGIIVLPTGSGKSFLAQLAMKMVSRSTLVVVPTLDLMAQWASQLEKMFGQKIGLLGGGSHEIMPITVSTYDSAVLQMEFIGNRFGLLIVDECHHLPGAVNRQLALECIAPFRLGLSATPERPDQEEDVLTELLGPICFRKEIDELEGKVLAPYETEQVPIRLEEDEAVLYRKHHAYYRDFIRRNNISFGAANGWAKFIIACSQLPDGSECMKSFLLQRKIARGSRAKLQKIWALLQRHHEERILIFTADNATAYDIGEKFCLPVLTHYTKILERRQFLDAFRRGEYFCLVTSKILNEGVDVPEAGIGIVVSGSGSVREHVQRLGRILRPMNGKRAHLYELVSIDTSECYVSEKRRHHRAYERSDTMSNPQS